MPRDHVGEEGRDREGRGDGDAVGRGQRARGLEADDNQNRADRKQEVHLRNVDLAHFVRGGVLDVEPREVSELDGLPRQREGARDERLRRDDRGGGGDRDERIEEP